MFTNCHCDILEILSIMIVPAISSTKNSKEPESICMVLLASSELGVVWIGLGLAVNIENDTDLSLQEFSSA